MKNITSLLFVFLLASSFIISCGSSSSDGDSGVKNNTEKDVPGSSDALSTDIGSSGDTNKPEVVPACESGKPVPGCN